jgi:hypothetical protein
MDWLIKPFFYDYRFIISDIFWLFMHPVIVNTFVCVPVVFVNQFIEEKPANLVFEALISSS